MTTGIPYGRQTISETDIESVVQVLRSDFLTQGPQVPAFEGAVARYVGVPYAVAVNSATAILHWNAIPVFADIDPETYCLDPASVEASITPYTKAIMAVDIFGQSADMDALKAIANKHGLKVISDTAQAPGALYKGKFAGTLAHSEATASTTTSTSTRARVAYWSPMMTCWPKGCN